MALRVLLADESSTIRKAIQMALAEYSVEVKSVQSGLDVLSVAHIFKPDIVLADVLLTKKNGYEVCAEIKKDPATRLIPVVLMWSSFLQIDHGQVSKVKANGTLEKPFDTDMLQDIVVKLVPKLSSFPLNGLLTHPRLPDFTESETFIRQQKPYQSGEPADKISEGSRPSSDADAVDDFSFQKPTSSQSQSNQDRFNSMDQKDDWSTTSADQFVLETENFGDFEEVTVINTKQGPSTPELQRRIQEQVNSYVQDSPLAKIKANENYNSAPNLNRNLNSNFDEHLIKEEIKKIAERICWQIIPDITEKIVREELNKLLQGLEKNT